MDVKQVAKLAHLEISDAEVETYTPQMAEIVRYVEQLNELETGDIEPMLGGLTAEGEATVTIRDDVPAGSLGQDAALSEAPSAVSGHFQVPKVLA
jgi:aspartyl-tRNA(Asn)/glutamyl-tRNA(Gln) amidotransferase subunit C